MMSIISASSIYLIISIEDERSMDIRNISMSKINLEVLNLSTLVADLPKFGNAEFPALKIGSTAKWYGNECEGARGWTDKSQACLGLTPDTKIIWCPVYLDDTYDYGDFTAFANANGLQPRILGARIVKSWFEENRDQIKEEAADYSSSEMDSTSVEAKLKAAMRAVERLTKLQETIAKKDEESK